MGADAEMGKKAASTRLTNMALAISQMFEVLAHHREVARIIEEHNRWFIYSVRYLQGKERRVDSPEDMHPD